MEGTALVVMLNALPAVSLVLVVIAAIDGNGLGVIAALVAFISNTVACVLGWRD